MGKQSWLLIIVLIGLVAAGVQLGEKAASETLWRQIGLAVDSREVQDPAWWPRLTDASVSFALVQSPANIADLPAAVQPVAFITRENEAAWRAISRAPAAMIYAENDLIESPEYGIFKWPRPVGIIDLLPANDFALVPDAWAGRLLRVYDRPAHGFINEFSIAVRERQADLVVVRLFADRSAEDNLAHVEAVSAALAADGHHFVAELKPRPAFPALPWVYYLQALAMGAAAALAGNLLWGRSCPTWLSWLPPGIALAVSVALPPLLGLVFARQLFALAAAILYPLLGFLWWWRRAEPTGHEKSSFGQSLLDFFGLTACSLTGGLSVHALLSLPAFQLKQLQFVGVKLAYAIPIGVALILVIWHWMRYSARRSRHGGGSLARLGGLLGLVALAGAVYLLLNRAGNESAIPISSLELTLRDWLDRVLWVRPRFKEFLGFPVLIGGFYLWRRHSLIPGGLALLLGFIGELSLVNTFEHLHHPILLSLLRSGLGIVIGLVLGVSGLLVLRAIWLRREV